MFWYRLIVQSALGSVKQNLYKQLISHNTTQLAIYAQATLALAVKKTISTGKH